MTLNREHTSTLITAELLRKWPLPMPNGNAGKEERGHVLVMGGSAQIPGAVILAACGALRAGAGKLQIATARSVAAAIAVSMPEARVIGLAEARSGELSARSASQIHKEVERCDALLVGPGMCDPRAATALINHCANSSARAALIVDAAALLTFADRTPLPRAPHGGMVLTPHAGEMAKVWGLRRDEVHDCAHEVAHEAASQLDAVVALKGACTHVAAPDGSRFHNTAGNIGLGTSGSGDALSGIIAGLCGRGADPLQAAVWGIYLHSKAGEALARKIGPLGFMARELLLEIPALMHTLGP